VSPSRDPHRTPAPTAPPNRGRFPISRAIVEAQAASADLTITEADLPVPPPVGRWAGDVLGRGHQARTLPLADDDEGPVVTTIVRYRPELDVTSPPRIAPPTAPRFAVLYLHGWSDYFLNPEIGPFWARVGGAFYGLDLRKYGRSLRVHQTPGYIADLATYDEDLAAALAVIEEEHPGLPLVIMAHSTGGLTASLWANRHPGRASGLVLVAPWLEMQGSTIARSLSMPIIVEIAKAFPKRRTPNPDLGFYARTTSAALGGEWNLVPAWRPEHGFPATYGWAAAVLAGHTQVAAGLDVACPVLVVRSSRTLISPVWDDAMAECDTVLDVDVIAQRALRIGRDVTVSTVEGALHDVLLSRRPVREDAYRRIERWAAAYLP